MKTITALSYLILLVHCGCQAQTTEKMNNQKNPLLCDPNEGFCALPDSSGAIEIKPVTSEKPVKVIYFTDPICSSCWGIEPQLRKLKAEYGQTIEIEYRMGGLLPDWSYNSGGISKPSDVAHHWDEVSLYYDMPIDGDIWLEDPLPSSYPPSIAFKAAQLQDNEKALVFLREIREMVFLHKKNITKWENLEIAARKAGLDTEQFKRDFDGKARQLFEEDLRLAKAYGVRGFPTMYFTDSLNNKETVYGTKPYQVYEAAVVSMNPAATKNDYGKDWKTLFAKYPSMTAKEFAELSGTTRNESEQQLNRLTEQGFLEKFTTKNGAIWTLTKQ